MGWGNYVSILQRSNGTFSEGHFPLFCHLSLGGGFLDRVMREVGASVETVRCPLHFYSWFASHPQPHVVLRDMLLKPEPTGGTLSFSSTPAAPPKLNASFRCDVISNRIISTTL